MAETQIIGIVGGGQLGRMLTLAAKPLGYDVVALDPSANCPAKQVGAKQIVGDLYDAKALKKLAKAADFLTIEIEHMNVAALETLEASGVAVNPSPATIRLIQDKYLQKVALNEAKIAVGPFVEVADQAAALQAFEQFGGKMLLKARNGAYDGRGNKLVQTATEVKKAFKDFAGTPLYAEKFVPFVKELAVMIARSTDGQVAIYPIVETIHKRSICDQVLIPAETSTIVHKRALATVKKVASLLKGSGVFGIEMFLTADGQVLINEIAPRVHNSGHYTSEVCVTSQFEQHIRAVSGLPLGSCRMLVPAAAMVNILGERNGPTKLEGRARALAIPEVSLHWYGKSPTKIDRKMGHITAIGDTIKVAKQRATKARGEISL